MKWAAILLMAGSSCRFGDETPKQFQLLFGKPLFIFPLQTILGFTEFSKIYLVVQEAWIEQAKMHIAFLRDDRIEIIVGGKTRQESSFIGIESAHASGMDFVLIHDAARPLVSKKIIEENLQKTPLFHAVDTCLKATDTLVKSASGETIDAIPNRSHMYQGQTPQSFVTSLIYKAHLNAKKQINSNATDDCSLVLSLNHQVGIVEGESSNFKITTPQDLLFAERLLPYLPLIRKQNNHSLENKVYVLCGATGDLGKSIGLLLEKEGAKVIRLSTSTPSPIDLSSSSEVMRQFATIYQEYGEVDGLILATGILHTKPYKDLTIQEIEASIGANLLSYLYPIQFAKIKSKGHILAFSSSSYLKGRGGIALYAALKASIANFIQGLAEENPEYYINAIAPCRCKSRMRKKAFPDEETTHLLHPIEVAKKAIDILRSEYTGLIIDVRKDPSLLKSSPIKTEERDESLATLSL